MLQKASSIRLSFYNSLCKHGSAWTFRPKAWTIRPNNIDVSAKKMDVSAKYIFNSFTESDIIISRGNHQLNCVRSLDKLMLHVQLSDCVHRL